MEACAQLLALRSRQVPCLPYRDSFSNDALDRRIAGPTAGNAQITVPGPTTLQDQI